MLSASAPTASNSVACTSTRRLPASLLVSTGTNSVMAEAAVPGPTMDEQAMRNEIVRLNKMVNALMNRAERSTSAQRSDFGMFQTAVMLEDQVRNRTGELEAAVRENEKIN